MAEAVEHALETGEHLLVQAGTGTGKSLAYLVPALLHSTRSQHPVVVATATIALQRQLVERDLPRVVDALAPLLGRRPEFAILKGRHNYACAHRLSEGAPDDAGDALFDPAPLTPLGRDFVRVRAWAEETETGDKDELVPAPLDRAWRAVSVTAHECVGRDPVPLRRGVLLRAGARASPEGRRRGDQPRDALDRRLLGHPAAPEHDAVIVDEAHELVDRATGAVTDELTAGVGRARSQTRSGATWTRRRTTPSSWRGTRLSEGLLGSGGGPGATGRRGCSSTRWSPCGTWVTARSSESAGKQAGASDEGVDAAKTQAQGRGRGDPRDRRAASSRQPSRTSSGSRSPSAGRRRCGARRCPWPGCCGRTSSARRPSS